MNRKLYIGNLPYAVTAEDLAEEFARFGTVLSANIVTDRQDHRSKGYGFVEFENEDAAAAAVDAMHGQDFRGRRLKVGEAITKFRD